MVSVTVTTSRLGRGLAAETVWGVKAKEATRNLQSACFMSAAGPRIDWSGVIDKSWGFLVALKTLHKVDEFIYSTSSWHKLGHSIQVRHTCCLLPP